MLKNKKILKALNDIEKSYGVWEADVRKNQFDGLNMKSKQAKIFLKARRLYVSCIQASERNYPVLPPYVVYPEYAKDNWRGLDDAFEILAPYELDFDKYMDNLTEQVRRSVFESYPVPDAYEGHSIFIKAIIEYRAKFIAKMRGTAEENP